MPRQTSNQGHHAVQFLRVGMLATTLLAGGCGGREPGGQTVATVDGDAITVSELNLELGAAGATPEARAAGQQQALQAIIDRRLLAEAARKDKLDKRPEFVLSERRMRDMLLAQQMVDRTVSGAQRRPTPEEINAYIESHLALGRARRILIVDQAEFPAPADAAAAAALAPLKTMDAVVQAIQAKGQAVVRKQSGLDSALVPDTLLRQLVATVGGEPLVVVRGPVATAVRVVGTQPTAAGSPAVEDVAGARIMRERTETAMRQRQAALRGAAKIEYDKAFAPPAQAKTGASAVPQ